MDALVSTFDGALDLALRPGDLVRDSGLQTAVLNSLFCDSRGPDAREGTDPRGWWGDPDGDEWGSQLWTLDREIASAENAENARQFAEAALAWLIADGVVERIEVEAKYIASGHLSLTVVLYRGDARQWQHAWEAMDAQHNAGGVTLHLRAAL